MRRVWQLMQHSEPLGPDRNAVGSAAPCRAPRS
jgi:hypothetical protein